jgi:hypothetical protein
MSYDDKSPQVFDWKATTWNKLEHMGPVRSKPFVRWVRLSPPASGGERTWSQAAASWASRRGCRLHPRLCTPSATTPQGSVWVSGTTPRVSADRADRETRVARRILTPPAARKF